MRQSLLRDASASAGAPGSPAYKVLLEQLTASCEELDVRKEEVLILRSQLVSQKEAMQHKVEESRRCSTCVRTPVGCCRMLQALCPHPCVGFSLCLFVCTKVTVTKGAHSAVSQVPG